MHNKKLEAYLKHEKIQMYLRVLIIAIVSISLFIYYDVYKSMGKDLFSYITLVISLYFLVIIAYVFVLNKYPTFYQLQRIKIMSIIEVVVSAYILCLGGEISAYFSFLFLLYIVGYAMRYGVDYGYIVYFTSLISWSLVLTYSDFWQNHMSVGLGWLVAFVIIPMYFFKLLATLHNNLEKAEYLGNHDSLTNLPNRLLFEKRLKESIDNYHKNQEKFALIFMDLDDFKMINDLHGHAMGDLVLVEASKRITQIYESSARLSGDEFVATVRYEEEDTLHDSLDELLDILSVSCKDKDITLSASIGIALFPKDATTAHELKKNADIAMYNSKNDGKKKYNFYTKVS